MLLNNEWVNNEIKEEMKRCLEINENEDQTIQNLWDIGKAIFCLFVWGFFWGVGFFGFLKIFIVIQLQLSAFSPHPSTPPQPTPLPSTNLKREIHSSTGLLQEARKTSNKQSNPTPKRTRKKNNKQSPE